MKTKRAAPLRQRGGKELSKRYTTDRSGIYSIGMAKRESMTGNKNWGSQSDEENSHLLHLYPARPPLLPHPWQPLHPALHGTTRPRSYAPSTPQPAGALSCACFSGFLTRHPPQTSSFPIPLLFLSPA
eukprot:4789465-Pleurochrysis_carterae.AAC.1